MSHWRDSQWLKRISSNEDPCNPMIREAISGAFRQNVTQLDVLDA